MLGAIIGDIAGSRFEFNNFYSTDFDLFGGEKWRGWQNRKCYFTDDTVMTVAVAQALLDMEERLPEDKSQWNFYAEKLHKKLRERMVQFGQKYPNAGYGGRFYEWLFYRGQVPYNSCGNGSAMRVSPVIWWARSEEEAAWLAERTAEISHNHPEGIKGARVTAVAGFMAKETKNRSRIEEYIRASYPEVKTRTYDQIKAIPHSELCQVTVPIAYEGFLLGSSYEDVIKRTISYGNDCDTTAAIAGGIAEAYYGIPTKIKSRAMKYLPEDMQAVVRDFYKKIFKADVIKKI